MLQIKNITRRHYMLDIYGNRHILRIRNTFHCFTVTFRNRICFILRVRLWTDTSRAVSFRKIGSKWLSITLYVWPSSAVDSPPFHLADRKTTSLRNIADALLFIVKLFWAMEAGCRKLLQTFVKISRDLTKREKEINCRKEQIRH
jgi:hypothetical protein